MHYTTAISPKAVIRAGPYGLLSLAEGNSVVLEALREMYAIALQRTFILALSVGCADGLCTFGMEMKNVKHEEKARREDKGAGLEGQERAGKVKGDDQQGAAYS